MTLKRFSAGMGGVLEMKIGRCRLNSEQFSSSSKLQVFDFFD
jgi:hypothetical protein